MKRKCRIWLPEQLTSADDLTHSLLFGWFVSHSSACFDVVVAFISDENSFSSGGSKLQVITPLQISFFSYLVSRIRMRNLTLSMSNRTYSMKQMRRCHQLCGIRQHLRFLVDMIYAVTPMETHPRVKQTKIIAVRPELLVAFADVVA